MSGPRSRRVLLIGMTVLTMSLAVWAAWPPSAQAPSSGQTFTPSPLTPASPQWTTALVLLALIAVFFVSVTVAARRHSHP